MQDRLFFHLKALSNYIPVYYRTSMNVLGQLEKTKTYIYLINFS